MAIDFRCEYCGRRLSLADSLAGRETSCPNCGVSLLVPGADPGQAPTVKVVPPGAGAQLRTVPCPCCREPIEPAARRCPFCGEQVAPAALSPLASDASVDSPATLSLVLGLVGILVCGLAAPFAIWQAGVARQRATALGVAVPGTATAGAILGWVVVALMAFAMLFVFGMMALAIVGGM
jgi:hypothetical protein